MSRFGSSATFYYNTGDTLASGTTIILDEADMPQYPFTDKRVTDEVLIRTKTGKIYQYQNYNKVKYKVKWSNLSEGKRNELATMANSLPILTFTSGGNLFGTFRLINNSFSSTEMSYELFDTSLEMEEES